MQRSDDIACLCQPFASERLASHRACCGYRFAFRAGRFAYHEFRGWGVWLSARPATDVLTAKPRVAASRQVVGSRLSTRERAFGGVRLPSTACQPRRRKGAWPRSATGGCRNERIDRASIGQGCESAGRPAQPMPERAPLTTHCTALDGQSGPRPHGRTRNFRRDGVLYAGTTATLSWRRGHSVGVVSRTRGGRRSFRERAVSGPPVSAEAG